MKKITVLLVNTVYKLAEPRNFRVMMFLLPVLIGIGTGSASLQEVGGNPGGCTAG